MNFRKAILASAILVVVFVVSSGGSHIALADDPDNLQVEEVGQIAERQLRQGTSGRSASQSRGAASLGVMGSERVSSTSVGNPYGCKGKSHNIHRSGHFVGNATGQADTWCNLQVAGIGVSAVLMRRTSTGLSLVGSAGPRAQVWTSRSPIKVNPGGECTLNPFDDNTYVLAAGHAAIALDGTRMSGTTGTARSLSC